MRTQHTLLLLAALVSFQCNGSSPSGRPGEDAAVAPAPDALVNVPPAPDAAVVLPDAVVISPDATVLTPDAALIMPDAVVVELDAALPAPDAEVNVPPAPDATLTPPDAAVLTPDATMIWPDAAVVWPDAAVPAPDAALTTPDAAVPTPDAALPDAALPPPPPPACPDVGLDPAVGRIHYVCDCQAGSAPGCVPGDDAAAGDAPDRPWRTIAQARGYFIDTRRFVGGDTMAFCRGGVFNVDAAAGARWNNSACTAGRPCVMRDYLPPGGDAALPAPTLQTTVPGNALALEDGGPADHEEGYVLLNLNLRGLGGNVGVFIYNDVDDVLMCNLDIRDFAIGVQVAGSNAPNPGSDGLNERITLRNSTLIHNSEQGYLGGCNDCAVEHSRFEDNGYRGPVFYHNIYFNLPNDIPTHRMRAVGNTLYRSAMVDGQCQGVSLVAHGAHDDLLIEDNRVREDPGAAGMGCWGIAVDSGYGSAEAFNRTIIRANTVENVGNVSVGVSACRDCVIENNVIVQTQAFESQAIAAPDRARGPEDQPMSGVIVRNNSIFFGAAAHGTGVLLGEENAGYALSGNAVQYVGAGPRWDCFRLRVPPAAYTTVDHNLCHAPAVAGGEWVDGFGTLAAWQAATGLDARSTDADPRFVDTAGPWDLQASGADSPLVDAGNPAASAPTDRFGLPRDATPDIGAFEWR
jgi:hypothetical protein